MLRIYLPQGLRVQWAGSPRLSLMGPSSLNSSDPQMVPLVSSSQGAKVDQTQVTLFNPYSLTVLNEELGLIAI